MDSELAQAVAKELGLSDKQFEAYWDFLIDHCPVPGRRLPKAFEELCPEVRRAIRVYLRRYGEMLDADR